VAARWRIPRRGQGLQAAAWRQWACLLFATRDSRSVLRTLDAVVEVATAIETAMGGRRRAPITVIDESGELVDL
jgi:hypothetical protein